MKFRTQFDVKGRVFIEPGKAEKTTLKLDFDKKGSMNLKESGKVNLYEEIQSHAESVDIHILLKRYANGDASALQQRIGDFVDLTAVPNTFAQILNVVNDAETTFAGLPADIRENFDNDPKKFLASFDNMDLLNSKLRRKNETETNATTSNDANVTETNKQ